MSLFAQSLVACVGAWMLSGCEPSPPPETTLQKQVKSCVADVKLGLGDPNSLEVLGTEEIPLASGAHRIELKFTAKNAMGGRVRGEALCGFRDKNSTELSAEDMYNKNRTLARKLNEIGIRLK